jgi:hypothetical protein
MRLTIVKDDGLVGVDGDFRIVDLSGLNPAIRAIQWNGNSGHIEYYEGPNSDLSDMSEFQSIVDLWTAAASPAPPEPTAAERIAAAHARINTSYQIAVNAITAGYPENEIASWPKQEEEARAFIADNTASAPWLRSAADARGITPDELASLIVANADALAPLHGSLTGKRQKLRDMIDGLGDNPAQSTLDTIKW